jgi:hypothetical protein
MPNVHRDVGNVRITYVPSQERSEQADWAGSDVVRIQAYRGRGRLLHRGAEFPVGDPADFIEFIRTLCEVYRLGRGFVQSPTHS